MELYEDLMRRLVCDGTHDIPNADLLEIVGISLAFAPLQRPKKMVRTADPTRAAFAAESARNGGEVACPVGSAVRTVFSTVHSLASSIKRMRGGGPLLGCPQSGG